jgi:hypothetical protein
VDNGRSWEKIRILSNSSDFYCPMSLVIQKIQWKKEFGQGKSDILFLFKTQTLEC